MNLCDDGHEEVCYECRHCPVCELAEEHVKEVATLRDEVKDLFDAIQVLETTNGEYLELFNEVKSAYPEFAI